MAIEIKLSYKKSVPPHSTPKTKKAAFWQLEFLMARF